MNLSPVKIAILAVIILFIPESTINPVLGKNHEYLFDVIIIAPR